jgi:beta-galactosidase/beta-glucuronidase
VIAFGHVHLNAGRQESVSLKGQQAFRYDRDPTTTDRKWPQTLRDVAEELWALVVDQQSA